MLRLTGLLMLCLAAPLARADDVVFREDFEHFDAKNWDDFGKDPDAMRIVEGGHHGKCVEFTATLGKNIGGHLFKRIEPGLDACYLRFYVKFENDHGYVHHFVNLVGYHPATRWPQGGAGERPKGDERFSTGIEPWGFYGKYPPPGAWNFYSYWCEMKASGDGKFWGNSFAPEKPALVERGRWIYVEILLKCNSAPDKADGEQAFWIDGQEIGRWKDIRWRTDNQLKISGVWILDYITELAGTQNHFKDQPKVNRVWFDDIVVSKAYIGPEKN